MRAVFSWAATGLLAFTFLAAQANAKPVISFGKVETPKGVWGLPAECEIDGDDLDCVTTEDGDVLSFSIVIENDADGMGGYSFGAQWDTEHPDGSYPQALTVDSATQARSEFLEVSAGPPPVNLTYNPLGGVSSNSEPVPVGPGGITQSSASQAGEATNWEAFSSSPDSATNILSANLSFRAGRIQVTVDNAAAETTVQLGWYNSLQDAFGTGAAVVLTEGDIIFGKATINAPEATAGLALLTGIACIALLGRRGRRSR